MGVGYGMASAWMRAIREGYKARQTMAHLSRSRWKYLGKQLNQRGSGIFIPILASYALKKMRKRKL